MAMKTMSLDEKVLYRKTRIYIKNEKEVKKWKERDPISASLKWEEGVKIFDEGYQQNCLLISIYNRLRE